MTPSSFHFLSPEWFWLLPIIVLLWLGLWLRQKHQGNWATVIDPDFHRVLLQNSPAQRPLPLPLIGLGILWLLALVALAGPTWKQVKIPASETQSGSIIVWDLSLSMLADDLKPNRLTQARLKLLDLLKQHPEIPMGLVTYAGSAHAVIPLSKDNGTLQSVLPALNPLLMPKFGSDPLQAFQLASQMLKHAHIKNGHILWVTDDVEPEQIDPIVSFFRQHPIKLSILAVGTKQGSPIAIPQQGLLTDQGQPVIAKLPWQRLQQLAQRLDAPIQRLSLANNNLTPLLPPATGENLADQAKKTRKGEQPTPKTTPQWLNMGPYLLWGLLPLFAFGFRKGWLSK